MKIDSSKIPQINNQKTNHKISKIAKFTIKEDEVKFQKSKPVKKVTYEKPHPVKEGVTIGRLKQESEKAHEHLQRLVQKLLYRQGHAVGSDNIPQDIPIDDITKAEAQALIAPNGPLGAEAVSTRIVDFAVALSGGDKGKLEELRGAITEGFAQVEKMLGGLPEVSKETYRLIMEKLDGLE